MVIGEPKTARPTMTVSIPLSSMLPSQLTRALPPSDAVHAPRAPRLGSDLLLCNEFAAASGPTVASSEMTCMTTTTMAVMPSVGFGLARM